MCARPHVGFNGIRMNRYRRPATTRPLRLGAVGIVALLVACGGTDERTLVTADVPDTVALGVLPDPLSNSPTLPAPPSAPVAPTSTSAATTTVVPGAIEGPVGGAVEGDRVLFVGDGTLESAAPGNSSRMCDALTLFGWDVEFAVASSDDLSFVEEALDERFVPDDDLDWDVLALFVGNELAGDALAVTEITEALDDAISRLAPRPVVLYTVSEVDPTDAALNDAIRSRAEEHPNVVVVDWAELGGDASEVIGDDGVSLTDDGRKRLAMQTAAAFQEAPEDQDGDCLPSRVGDTAD